jgi:DNA-binding SARP family transcriptional activator
MAPGVAQIHTLGGGSREQKDIFRDVFMELHRRLGRVDAVVALAQERLLANPYHVPSLAAMAWAYEKTGDAARQRQACRQLVQRAEAVGAADDAEELVAARGVLRASV